MHLERRNQPLPASSLRNIDCQRTVSVASASSGNSACSRVPLDKKVNSGEDVQLLLAPPGPEGFLLTLFVHRSRLAHANGGDAMDVALHTPGIVIRNYLRAIVGRAPDFPVRPASPMINYPCLGGSMRIKNPSYKLSGCAYSANISGVLSRTLTLAALVVCSPISAGAQGFSIEQVLSSPFPSELTSALHGQRIAWVFNKEGDRNVWVAEGPGFAPHQVTQYQGDNGQPIASLRLTPDGSTLVYARGTEVNAAGLAANPNAEPTQPLQQVWTVPVSGGEPRLLGEMGCPEEGCEDIEISPDGKYAVWPAKHQLWIATLVGGEKATQLTNERGDASSPVWSPDSSSLAYTLNRGDHALIAVDKINGGKVLKIGYVSPSVDLDMQPRWSPDGSHLAFMRVPGPLNKRPIIPEYPEPWSIWVADASTLLGSQIWKSGASSRDSLPHFAETSFYFAEGNRVVFDSEQDGWAHLYSIDAAKGGKPALLTPGEFSIEDVSLSADRRAILFSSNQDDIDRRHLWRVDAAGGKLPVALTRGETIEWSPIETGDGSAIVCLGSTATTPALVYSVAGGQRTLLTKDAVPADFPQKLLVTPKQAIFQSADGLTIHGQLFLPKRSSKPGPALIFVHGGPVRQMLLGFHYMDYYHDAYAANQYLASLGFTVLSVNYRLGVMYGHDFRMAPQASWRGSSEYKDVLAGAQYLKSLPQVDPKRIGIWGGSYGGLLTALGLARNSDIFAAGVDFHGVHDWSEFLTDWQRGAKSAPDYEQAVKLAWESSPDSSVDKWKSPVLLIQGDDDRNVPFNQMVDLVQRLRENNVPFDQIVYPDEIHDFLLHRHFVEGYKATAEFFTEHLGTASGAPR